MISFKFQFLSKNLLNFSFYFVPEEKNKKKNNKTKQNKKKKKKKIATTTKKKNKKKTLFKNLSNQIYKLSTEECQSNMFGCFEHYIFVCFQNV